MGEFSLEFSMVLRRIPEEIPGGIPEVFRLPLVIPTDFLDNLYEFSQEFLEDFSHKLLENFSKESLEILLAKYLESPLRNTCRKLRRNPWKNLEIFTE